MSALEALIKIIRGVTKDFDLPKDFNPNADVFVKDENNEAPVLVEDNRITVYAKNPSGREISRQVFATSEQILEKGERAIETSFADLISEAEPFAEQMKTDAVLVKTLQAMVPPSDIPIIEAALFIRRVHLQDGNVRRYKELISRQYQSRGANISNLMTANYYEKYLIPTYEHLVNTEGELAKSIFDEIYEEAITQYPFAVFVSSLKAKAQIKEEILDKIKFNLLNKQHVLNIHGIGEQNRKTITDLLEDPDITQYYVSEPSVVNLEKTVYVKVYF